ncbi:hypothetical protein [Rivibacter subsaxonicus]|uniref:Phospholipid:lipid A palmitoyltransferase n=1 Tax=Rivibacter subsaxonicus TaxID=457575 RepID=A0A4Q7VZR4_9BURK|nr:hypothetical protein [Rivibacter subsaxonicus]RZU02357.1 hypothetical protein EV670_0380 [Rivibacter subsaxonicus]
MPEDRLLRSIVGWLMAILLALLALAAPAHAEPDFLKGWDGRHDRDLSATMLQISPYTLHFSPSPDHQNVYLLGAAAVRADGWMAGGAYFSNSFGQPTVYAFVGRKYLEPFGWERVYWTWTAGILYGYVDDYRDEVPFNVRGFSPGFVPTVGYMLTPRTSVQVAILGTAGLMFSLVFDLAP